MKPRKAWCGWFVAITTGWVQVCCVHLCGAGGTVTLSSRSRDRESRVTWPKEQGDLSSCAKIKDLSFYVRDMTETCRGYVGCGVKFLEIEISCNFFLERTALEMFRWGCSDPARIRYTPMTKNGTTRPENPRNSVLPEDGVKKRYKA